MCKQHWLSGYRPVQTVKTAAQIETDKALQRERDAEALRLAQASAALFQKKEPGADVLQLAGLEPHAGYVIEMWDKNQGGPSRWRIVGATLDLSTACHYADQQDTRVSLRRVYRLLDGSLTLVPQMNRVTEIARG